ncbi:hypothetical protein ACFVAV_04275 [Nocardia sp. NPDC057663]|uniref:hypothetical protein n=1 Tax=Nocardia sp. NPDC057663 TaxID=3346201 RepID=UPI003672043E
MTDTRGELEKQIAAIRSSENAIGNLPQKVQDWHGDLVKIIRTGGYSGAVVNPANALTVEAQVDLAWGNRDKINTALGETGQKLAEMNPGLEIPVTFMDFAYQWRMIRNDIYAARTSFGETDLIGEWTGDAATRYRELRIRQDKAFPAMSSLCENIAVNLESVAAAELTLYTTLATQAQQLVEKVTSFCAKMASSFFNLPFGPLTASTDLVTVVQASNTFILGITSSVATSAQANLKAANSIASDLKVQQDIPDNHWPPGVVASYGSGAEGLRVALGDASVNDGDKSDWSHEA